MNKLFLALVGFTALFLAGCIPFETAPNENYLTCGSPEHIAAQAAEDERGAETITLKGGMVIPSGYKPMEVPCIPPVPEDCQGDECYPDVCLVDCVPTPTCEDTNTCVVPTCEDTDTCVVVVEECKMPITASDRAEDNSGKERCKDVGTNYETETDDRHDNSVKEDTDTENNPDGDEDDATDGETSTPPNDNPNAAFNR